MQGLDFDRSVCMQLLYAKVVRYRNPDSTNEQLFGKRRTCV